MHTHSRLPHLLINLNLALALFSAWSCGNPDCEKDELTLTSYDDKPVQTDCETVAGNLKIDGPGVNLPNLKSIGGDLVVLTRTGFGDLDLPGLETVGGNIVLFINGELQSIKLPALATVGGDIDFQRMENLTSINLDSLKRVEGALRLNTIGDVGVLRYPSLEYVGGDFGYAAVPGSRLEAPLLRSIGRALAIESNPNLTSFSLDALTEVLGFVVIHDNAELTSFTMSNLTRVTQSLGMYDNPKLPQCLVDAWAQDVQAQSKTLSNNDVAAICQ